jgi:hypothetical protein
VRLASKNKGFTAGIKPQPLLRYVDPWRGRAARVGKARGRGERERTRHGGSLYAAFFFAIVFLATVTPGNGTTRAATSAAPF